MKAVMSQRLQDVLNDPEGRKELRRLIARSVGEPVPSQSVGTVTIRANGAPRRFDVRIVPVRAGE